MEHNPTGLGYFVRSFKKLPHIKNMLCCSTIENHIELFSKINRLVQVQFKRRICPIKINSYYLAIIQK